MAAHERTRRVPLMAVLLVLASFAGGVGMGYASAADTTTAASLTAEPRTTGDVSVHTVELTAEFDGNLSKVLVDYGTAGDVDGASVEFLGVDRNGDGTVDRRYPAAIGVRASRVHVVPRGNVTLSPGDRVVVALAGVRNPRTAGLYDARITVRTTGGSHTAVARYRVTPFRTADSLVRNVTAPRSSVDAVFARDSVLRDSRIVRSDWDGVILDGVRTRRLHSRTDHWQNVTATATTFVDVDSRRSAYRDAVFTGTSLTDVRFHRADTTGLAVVGTTVRDVTVAGSTLDRVAVVPAAEGDDAEPVLAVGDRVSTWSLIETAETQYDASQTDSASGANRLTDVTLRDSTLRGVVLANTTLENVTFRGVTLEHVTLRNVTLRDVTVTDRTFTNATITDETVTSERRLAYEFRTDDGLDAPATGAVTVENGTATASTDGAVESTHHANETGVGGEVSSGALD